MSLPTQEDSYNIEIDFGDKVLHFRPWKGKERRLINELLTKEGYEPNKIADILTYGCMQEKDVFLNENQKQYVMFILKAKSVIDYFVFDYPCSECKNINTEIINYDDILKPRLAEYSSSSFEGIEFKFNNIQHNPVIFKKLTSLDNQFDAEFYELALTVNNIKIGEETIEGYSLEELVFFLDNLDIKIFNDLVEDFRKQRFEFKPTVECECQNEECKHKNTILVDVIPNFVEDWIE